MRWLVRHEKNCVAVVLQTRMNAGKVSLGQFDQLILILADDGFAARTRNVCLHVAAFPFAAAFICFLCDRTCPSERASTISATDMHVPGLPNSPAASRQPVGVTPYCLPSNAKKIFAFCSPKPGSPLSRRSSSLPSGSPAIHTAAASPS